MNTMKIKGLLILVIAFSLISSQQISAQNSTFPYQLSLKKDIIISSGGLLISTIGGLIPMQSQNDDISYFNNLNKNDVNSFDRWATNNWNTSSDNLRDNLRWGSLFSSITLIPALTALSNHGSSGKEKLNNALVISAMGLEGFSYVFGLTVMSKALVTRNRPYTYNSNLEYAQKVSEGEYKESFFSGTTATTSFAMFFSAKVINDVFDNSHLKYAAWGCAALYTGYVGYLAIDAGQHFPTDVLVGALIGGTFGVAIPHIHKTKANKKQVSLQPTFNNPGLRFSMVF